MSLINQFESITGNQSDFGFTTNGIFFKLISFVKKFDSIFLVSFVMMIISRKVGTANKLAQKEIMEKSTGNEMLDLYYGEGMKLFSQGPYSKNINLKKSGDGL